MLKVFHLIFLELSSRSDSDLEARIVAEIEGPNTPIRQIQFNKTKSPSERSGAKN